MTRLGITGKLKHTLQSTNQMDRRRDARSRKPLPQGAGLPRPRHDRGRGRTGPPSSPPECHSHPSRGGRCGTHCVTMTTGDSPSPKFHAEWGNLLQPAVTPGPGGPAFACRAAPNELAPAGSKGAVRRPPVANCAGFRNRPEGVARPAAAGTTASPLIQSSRYSRSRAPHPTASSSWRRSPRVLLGRPGGHELGTSASAGCLPVAEVWRPADPPST
jgi:hypothetical protein